jgi:hypothetical protein
MDLQFKHDVKSGVHAHEHEFTIPIPHSESHGPLKVGTQGFPLRPQPSDDPMGK